MLVVDGEISREVCLYLCIFLVLYVHYERRIMHSFLLVHYFIWCASISWAKELCIPSHSACAFIFVCFRPQNTGTVLQVLPPASAKLLRAIVWNYSTIKAYWTLKNFAYFYFFRTFRILWIDFRSIARGNLALTGGSSRTLFFS